MDEEFRKAKSSPEISITVIGVTSDSEEAPQKKRRQSRTSPQLTYFECTLTNRNELDTVVEHRVKEFLNLNPKSLKIKE